MNRESVQKLRLDRRLVRRRGWISESELGSALSELPDAAAKATTLGEASDAGSNPAPEPVDPTPPGE